MTSAENCLKPRPVLFAAFLAWAASVPVILPNITTLDRLLWAVSDGRVQFVFVEERELTILFLLSLALMFTALAVLLVCLLKTAFGNIPRGLVVASAIAYLGGWAALLWMTLDAAAPAWLCSGLSGALLGFGAGMAAMSWARLMHVPRFRCALRLIILAALAALAVDALVGFLAPRLGLAVIVALSIVGTVGCVWGSLAGSYETPVVPGSNWWDIFGKLDTSLLDDPRGFSARSSRILFLMVVPAVMLLMLIADMDISKAVQQGGILLGISGCVIGTVLTLPLLFIRDDAHNMTFAYRFYLPAIAFVILIAGNFVSEATRTLVIGVGIYAYFTAYLLVMVGMALTMMGKMESLELPGMAFMMIAAGLIALLTNSQIEAGALEAFAYQALLVLFIASIALLLITPSFDLWDLALGDAPGIGEALEERCARVAQRYHLTAREGEILRYLGRGHGSAYIANTLVVAESTVRTHVKSIYQKTGVTSREELIELIDAA